MGGAGGFARGVWRAGFWVVLVLIFRGLVGFGPPPSAPARTPPDKTALKPPRNAPPHLPRQQDPPPKGKTAPKPPQNSPNTHTHTHLPRQRVREDEHVIYPHRQHQKGYDLEADEGRPHAKQRREPRPARDARGHYQHAPRREPGARQDERLERLGGRGEGGQGEGHVGEHDQVRRRHD